MTEKLTGDAAMEDMVEERLRVILKEGAETPMNFEWITPELPSFYDERKFQLGQQAYNKNVFSFMIAKLSGLLALMSIKTILDVVTFTKRSNTPCTAYRRYAATVLHTHIWLTKEPGKMNEFLESLKTVRKLHCVAFKKSAEACVHKATQLDMALAQFGFIGFIIISREQLGIDVTREELEGIVHLWRVIGSMLGMDDKFNLCTGTPEETCALCQKILEDIFLPCLIKKNEHSDRMSRVLLEALWPINVFINPQAYTAFTYHMVSSSISNNNHSLEIDTSNMPFYSWYLYNFQYFTMKYLLRPSAWWSSFFRSIFNNLMLLSIFLTDKYPFIATWTFGEKYTKLNIFNYSD